MINPPLNGLSWTLGFIATFPFSIKSLRAGRATGNQLGTIYGWIGLTLSLALFCFGVPALLTTNVHILRYTGFAGDCFVQACLQAVAWLLWFVGLRTRVKLRTVFFVTVPVSALVLILQLITSQASTTLSPHIVNYTDESFVLVLNSIIYLALALPTGYFFARQVTHQRGLASKAKSAGTALVFITVSIAATVNNVLDRGGDSADSAIFMSIVFAIFLIISILPKRQISTTAK